MADPDGVDAEADRPGAAEGDEQPPPDESFLLGRAGGDEQLLAEVARAEAELHDPQLHQGDGTSDDDAVI